MFLCSWRVSIGSAQRFIFPWQREVPFSVEGRSFDACAKVMRQAYSKMLMEQWQPYLDNYKPAFANSVSFQELTLGTVAPQSEGLASALNNFCCKSGLALQCPILYMCLFP